jgi:hypothetical protein
MQSAGINGLLRYSPQILEQVGVVSLFSDIGLGSHSTAILISALNALLMLPCITASMILMDICGRRLTPRLLEHSKVFTFRRKYHYTFITI